MDVTVEVVGGTRASVASDISLLETCLKTGKISLETYIKAYPDSAITNKEEILKHIKQEKDDELSKTKIENNEENVERFKTEIEELQQDLTVQGYFVFIKQLFCCVVKKIESEDVHGIS